MKKMRTRTRLWLLILLGLMLLSLIGFVAAKYMDTFLVHTGGVTVDARLATDITVREYAVERKSSGKYELLNSVAAEANEYVLMPGVDIAMDPFVDIQGKTQIPAYLYLTVECDNEALSFSLQSHWKQIGSSNEYVYAYDDGTPIPITANPGEIHILLNNTVYVSQYLLSKDTSTKPITFTATLREVVEE